MKIKILYFAEAKKIIKKNSEQVNFSGENVGDLKKFLSVLHPAASQVFENSMFAVNLEYANKDTFLDDGDTVAVIPPVEGG